VGRSHLQTSSWSVEFLSINVVLHSVFCVESSAMSLSQAILPQSSIDLMASLLPSASLTLHQHYWPALHLLRTNHRPLLSLYKQHTEVLSSFTLEDGTDRFSHNISTEFPLYTMQSQKSADLRIGFRFMVPCIVFQYVNVPNLMSLYIDLF
jgi:hypothetical protein